MNSIRQLRDFGQSIWYDNIQRAMLGPGNALERMIEEDGLRGITSNPAIFEKAINGSSDYDGALVALLEQGGPSDPRSLFFSLAVEDIQRAADQFLPVYQSSGGEDGYVSLEVSPDLAYDTQASIDEAKALVERVNRPNLMIKIPATRQGLGAIEALTAAGINVNATLLFSVHRYEEVAQAYLSGLRQRLEAGLPVNQIASVASFFISRVDGAVDAKLRQIEPHATPADRAVIAKLLGTVAIANAKVAYGCFRRIYHEEFEDLAAAGARPQRLLWASTGVKDPAYRDVRYIEELIGEQTVNTVPPATYDAFKDHGKVAATLDRGLLEAGETLEQLRGLGIDLAAITKKLESDGVAQFEKAFATLLEAIDAKVAALSSQAQQKSA